MQFNLLETNKNQFPKILIAACIVVLAACAPVSDNTAVQSVAVRDSSSALELVAAEAAGMDTSRLDRVTAAMQGFVDDGLLAGVVTMAARDNKIVHFESVGYRDLEAQAPMTNDAIFRIYSMSKPITGVALMVLYEEGKFRLADPVEMYLPELKDLQVYAGEDENGNMITEPQNHKMTIRELMSHTGGLTYGIFAQSAVDTQYQENELLSTDLTLQEFTSRLGSIPLKHQPGSLWEYSVSVDVQGYLVEKLAGQSFGEFLEERIFDPLGMTDTDFHVPEEKVSRFAQVYNYDDSGELQAAEIFDGANFLEDPVFESGGGGLVSTAMDYMRFSQMLLNGGELDGVRILAPLTVDLMHRDQTPPGMGGAMSGLGGTSFGLDFAIIEDPVEAEGYSTGEYYWGGAAGTWFWIDPVEELVFVGMIQQTGSRMPDVRSTSKRLIYQSIMEPNGI
ncbi:MAG TPA: serine hydrolase domain-containing protein [Gammaproteobacteria bacterium]|nr:serine hydrolase domain-containing protein [Gammaproteobacteria bacterium]